VLLTEDDVFAVCNTGASEMKWEGNAELRLWALLMIDLRQHRLPSQYGNIESGAIMFGADMGRMLALMGVGGDKRRKYFALKGHYRQFYIT